MSGEKPTQQPKEGQEITREQAKAIADSLHNAISDINKFDIKGNNPRGAGFYFKEGKNAYTINPASNPEDDKMQLAINKYEVKLIGDDKAVASLFLNVDIKEGGIITITMDYDNLNDPNSAKWENGHTLTRVGSIECKKGECTNKNSAALKEKANKFLGMLNKYIKANKPKNAGSKEVREF